MQSILQDRHLLGFKASAQCEGEHTRERLTLHSDLWGPSLVSTTSRIRWFVTFVDDCTCITWLYMLKNKSEVCDVFHLFQQMIKTQYSFDIKVLRSDNGGEYINFELS